MVSSEVVGSEVVGSEVAGSEVVGSEVVGDGVVSDGVGSEVVGSEVVGSEVVGSEVVGSEVVGSEVVGSKVVGSEVVGDGVVSAVAVVAVPSTARAKPSLIVPGDHAVGPIQVSSPEAPMMSCNDVPSLVVSSSATPMSIEVKPEAAPLVATKLPSYERNSITLPAGSINATASGAPFCMRARAKKTAPYPLPISSSTTPSRMTDSYCRPVLPL